MVFFAQSAVCFRVSLVLLLVVRYGFSRLMLTVATSQVKDARKQDKNAAALLGPQRRILSGYINTLKGWTRKDSAHAHKVVGGNVSYGNYSSRR